MLKALSTFPALGSAEKMFRKIVETSQEGIWIVGLDGHVEYLNPQMAEMLGYRTEEVIGRPLFDFLSEEAKQVAQRKLNQRFEGISEHHEFSFLRRDGTTLHTRVSASPIQNDQGKIVGSLGMFTDLTEMKKGEDERKRFFDLPTHLLCIAGTDGFFKDANPAFLQALGYPREVLLSKPFIEFVHADDVARTLEEAERLNRETLSINFENRYRGIDGTYRSFFWAAVRHGNTIYCVIRDVTENRKTEEALRLRDLYFKEMCEVMPQIVWTSEPDGNLDFYNRHWFEYTGMTLEETQGWGWKPILHPDDVQNCIDRWTRSIQTGEDYEVEYRFRRASDGQYRWHLGRALPLRGSDGKIVKWFGTCTDIDDQKRNAELLEIQVREKTELLQAANIALIQSAKMSALGEMAGGIAHEINNPLAILHSQAELLQAHVEMGRLDISKLKSATHTISNTVQRVAKIVGGLRSFARDGASDPVTKVKIAHLILSTLDFCRERFKNRGISLEIGEIDPDLALECREVQISQVILNLLNNAFDAIEGTTRPFVAIDVSLKSTGRIEISITDSGKGIPKEIAAKIMQPFFTTKEIGKGTGLGLSISSGIVRSHQGEFFLDQDFRNTRFVVRLPTRQP